MRLKLIITVVLFLPFLSQAQLGDNKKKFTKADTLRGSLNENRDWWDVLRYDIEVRPDYESKSISGKSIIRFKYVKPAKKSTEFMIMQIDLQQPLIIDSILVHLQYKVSVSYGNTNGETKRVDEFAQVPFVRQGNIAKADLRSFDQNYGDSIIIYYHGKPREAKNPPWDGGWIWKKDSLGRPWMSVAVQGLGASAWYPCKDHQSDEPDNGASLTIIVPDSLITIANGKAEPIRKTKGSFTITSTGAIKVNEPEKLLRIDTWEVRNPINNYNIVPYIGKYATWNDTLNGEKGKLDLGYWVLDYNLERAKQQFQQVKPMLRCFEHWFGPYAFYEDGFKMVESPHLGMEHQSAIAYGNKYRNGFLGKDLSGSGWGTKWDFIIVHESAHEWFGNNITTKDIADMWVHEGFTSYSETLYTEWLFGKQAGDEYNHGIRKLIDNDKPIIGPYGVNEEGSGDMYYKASNMINIIRKVINNDSLFRKILRGMNETFWHQTVSTQQIESYIIKESGISFQKTFDQYLRTTQVPKLEFHFTKDKKKVHYRWVNCIDGFDLPLVINNKRYAITTKWNSAGIANTDLSAWNKKEIEKLYYINVKQVKP
jgi:aminopeptidase N